MQFREMLRSRQQLTREECLCLLREEKRGVLSVVGDGGWPYGLPLNHYYCEEDGTLYFHSGPRGHKLDALRGEERASYCVLNAGERREGDWALTFCSVIVFGRVRFVEDRGKIYDIARRLSYKFTQDEAYIRHELEHSGPSTAMFALCPEHISGKRVHEA